MPRRTGPGPSSAQTGTDRTSTPRAMRETRPSGPRACRSAGSSSGTSGPPQCPTSTLRSSARSEHDDRRLRGVPGRHGAAVRGPVPGERHGRHHDRLLGNPRLWASLVAAPGSSDPRRAAGVSGSGREHHRAGVVTGHVRGRRLCWQTRQPEYFSSQGPTIDGRTKPDIAGHDSVSGATYGGFSACARSAFAGTPAAAPEVAGAAALVKQAFPAYGPDQLQQYLQRSALDMAAPGMDNVAGAGELQLPKPPDIVPPTSRALASSGRAGKTVRLLSAIADDEGTVSSSSRSSATARSPGRFDVRAPLSHRLQGPSPLRGSPLTTQRERSDTAPLPSTQRGTGVARAARRSC